MNPGTTVRPVEVDHDVGIGQPTLDVVVAADRHDSVVFNYQRSGPSTVRVHREDVTVGPDLESWRGRMQAQPRDPASNDDHEDQRYDRPDDPFDDLEHRRAMLPSPARSATLTIQ